MSARSGRYGVFGQGSIKGTSVDAARVVIALGASSQRITRLLIGSQKSSRSSRARYRPKRLGSWRMASATLAGALACTALVAPAAQAASDGTMDSAFTINNGTGANGAVESVAVQADGKSIVGGAFTTWNGAIVGGVVRLNTDGTRDTAFTTGTGTSGTVFSVAVQADQKTILGGYITAWNGAAVGGVVRLNTNGTHDTAFTTNNGTGVNGNVRSVAVQANQSIILGGAFTTWDSAAVGYVVRLDALG